MDGLLANVLQFSSALDFHKNSLFSPFISEVFGFFTTLEDARTYFETF